MRRSIIGGIVCYVGLLIIIFSVYTSGSSGTGVNATNVGGTLARGEFFMADLTRQELARRAAKLGAPILIALEKPETVVERVPTGFFSDDGIYRVSTQPPDRPRLYVLGVWGTDGIRVLNGDPEGYFDLAAHCGLKLSTGNDYVTYVTTFLDATRDFTGGVQVLNKIEESWWLPSPTPEEARKREEVIAKYANVVEAPKASHDSNSTVFVYCIRDRVLLRMKATVESGGKIQISEDVLEAEMPTVMLR